MNLSQKCQYALRAVFELAKQYDSRRPTPISAIAEAQAIPPRFLELILGQLKQTGYLESRRGVEGGYLLSVSPKDLAVGDIIRFVEGPLDPVKCIGAGKGKDCPLLGNCAFESLWDRARDAVAAVYDGTTFQDLLDDERASSRKGALDYCI